MTEGPKFYIVVENISITESGYVHTDDTTRVIAKCRFWNQAVGYYNGRANRAILPYAED